MAAHPAAAGSQQSRLSLSVFCCAHTKAENGARLSLEVLASPLLSPAPARRPPLHGHFRVYNARRGAFPEPAMVTRLIKHIQDWIAQYISIWRYGATRRNQGNREILGDLRRRFPDV
jgi:hypothetical protein